MEILSHPVVATVIFLGILVFVHEAGHFLVGKLSGIAVEIFSIGFGPSIFNFKRAETSYRISIIPLGGFVKFYGSVPSEPVPDELKGREFYKAPLWARLVTIAAGPLANFLLAVVAFTIIGMMGVQQPKAIVGEIMLESPAERAGLKFMDVITEVNGKSINNWRNLQRVIADNPDSKLDLKVLRNDGTQANLQITPEAVEDSELAKTKGRIGISPNFIPSVLTVTKSGPASEAGLKTGHRVTFVETSQGLMPIKYYRQILNQFEVLLAESPQMITLKVNMPGEENAKEDETITINIAGHTFNHGSELMNYLGLSDSQLTVDQPGEGIQGVEHGDLLVSWNSKPITSIFDLNEIIMENRSADVSLEVIRNNERMIVKPLLKPMDVQKIEGKVTIYALSATFLGVLEQGELIEEKYSNPIEALGFGITETYNQSKMIGGAVIGLFTGDMPLNALGGPIAIAKVASDSVKLGLLPFLSLLALISINLGLFNLIPIPILDGGQLLLIGAEGVARRPLPESAIEGFQKIGFVMVLALIAMATYNDLGRFWASMMKGFSTLF